MQTRTLFTEPDVYNYRVWCNSWRGCAGSFVVCVSVPWRERVYFESALVSSGREESYGHFRRRDVSEPRGALASARTDFCIARSATNRDRCINVHETRTAQSLGVSLLPTCP